MRIVSFTSQVPIETGILLEEFEREFLYPLGPSQKFRISHGREYLPFFRALGESTLLVAQQAEQVIGTLVFVKRRMLQVRDGNVREVSAYYFCDLKVRESWRGSSVLARLILAARERIEPTGCRRAYCVVMDGTGRLPIDYTGRLEIPRFESLGKLMILRVQAAENLIQESHVRAIDLAEVEKIRSSYSLPGVSAITAAHALRSQLDPLGLATESRDACGVLEDTRRGKRLQLEAGSELVSAHLSQWAWSHPAAGVRLLAAAAARCQSFGLPALFTAVPIELYADLAPRLRHLQLQEAPATVYGCGFEHAERWWIDTSEI